MTWKVLKSSIYQLLRWSAATDKNQSFTQDHHWTDFSSQAFDAAFTLIYEEPITDLSQDLTQPGDEAGWSTMRKNQNTELSRGEADIFWEIKITVHHVIGKGQKNQRRRKWAGQRIILVFIHTLYVFILKVLGHVKHSLYTCFQILNKNVCVIKSTSLLTPETDAFMAISINSHQKET